MCLRKNLFLLASSFILLLLPNYCIQCQKHLPGIGKKQPLLSILKSISQVTYYKRPIDSSDFKKCFFVFFTHKLLLFFMYILHNMFSIATAFVFSGQWYLLVIFHQKTKECLLSKVRYIQWSKLQRKVSHLRKAMGSEIIYIRSSP